MQTQALAHIQETNSSRAIEFVCACRQKVYFILFNINRDVTDRLYCVRMKQRSLRVRMPCKISNDIPTPDFIICRHDGNEFYAVLPCSRNLIWPDASFHLRLAVTHLTAL